MSRAKKLHEKRLKRKKTLAQREKNKHRQTQLKIDRLMGKIIRAGDENENLLYAGTEAYDVSSDLNQAREDVLELQEVLDVTRFGVGLAGPQIGIQKKVVVWKKTPNSPMSHMINPEIIKFSEDTQSMNEGCLSYPGYFVEIERSAEVTIKYDTLEGESKETEFAGWEARVLQHEIDHLNGICKVGQADEADRNYSPKAKKASS